MNDWLRLIFICMLEALCEEDLSLSPEVRRVPEISHSRNHV